MTRKLKLTALVLTTIAAHALIFVGTAAGLKSFGSVDVGAVAWSHQYYYDYASEALSGKIPYRDFAFEYPLFSFPLFLIPRLLSSDFESYRGVFMTEMFLFNVAAIVLIARYGAKNE